MKITMYFSDKNGDAFTAAANIADNKFGKKHTTVRYLDQRSPFDAVVQIDNIDRVDAKKKRGWIYINRGVSGDTFSPDEWIVES